MMKRILILTVVLAVGATTLGLSQPPAADAAGKKWYWTEGKAEKRVKRYFSDVRTAWCIGFGYNWRYDRYGREVFTAFYCSGRLLDATDYQITIYTKGKKRFKWYPY
jgi:hypothetical protein